MDEKRRFLNTVRKAFVLGIENSCGWTDEQFKSMSDAMEQMIELNKKAEVSRDGAARILGCSTRTLQRKVESGEIPPPHRNGDKSGIKFYIDDLKS